MPWVSQSTGVFHIAGSTAIKGAAHFPSSGNAHHDAKGQFQVVDLQSENNLCSACANRPAKSAAFVL
jgi:hypothetical protein